MKIRDELRAGADNPATDDPIGTELAALAVAVRSRAYAPYSKYAVGAALLTGSGTIFTGVNIENSSYGLCNCAERTAIFTAVAAGERSVSMIAVATDDGGTPCGACRQVMAEFAPRDGSPLRILLVDRDGSVVLHTTLAELLPMAFTLRP